MPNSNIPSCQSTPSPWHHEWALPECREAEPQSPAPHQEEALTRLGRWYETRHEQPQGGLLVLPTGGGKTFTAVRFLTVGPLSDGYKVLWLAHTHHLLEQAFNAFDGRALGLVREPRQTLRIRVVSGTTGHFPPRDITASDDVVIATLQTVSNAYRQDHATLRQWLDSANGKLAVVFDEAHHAPANTYRKLLQSLQDEGALTLGLTATPTYTDERKRGWLAKLFPQGVVAQARASELMARGILSRPRFERLRTEYTPTFTEAEYQRWLGSFRDIPEHIIDTLAHSAERNGFIAEHYAKNRERYGKTLMFTDRWYQCEAIAVELENRGVRAGAIYSRVDGQLRDQEAGKARQRDDNARVLERFRDNELDVLINVRMLTEGTDVPEVQTVFLTRQTTSRILLTQMVGRALRGEKFGGTPEAYVVSFLDNWEQPIPWAEFDPMLEGPADDGDQPSPERAPLQLISIELVRRLARKIGGRNPLTTHTFASLMPVGWYLVSYDARSDDDVAAADRLVMVMDDEREGFEQLIAALLKYVPAEFESEEAIFADLRDQVEGWRQRYFPEVARGVDDILFDLFELGRHVGQGHGAPRFFTFEVRESHDLDRLAQDYVAQDLGPRAIKAALQAEFDRLDRFWKGLFGNFGLFWDAYDACQRRLLSVGEAAVTPEPRMAEVPTDREPSDEVKDAVKRRDGRCLACGTTRRLQVDHIDPWYHGGGNDDGSLQTLCKTCNRFKGTKRINFRVAPSPRVLDELACVAPPEPRHVGDVDRWEQYLRRVFNFSFGGAAVTSVDIGKKGPRYYNWTVDLATGLEPKSLAPHLKQLVLVIRAAREEGGKPAIQSLTITAPNVKRARWPLR